MKLYIKASLSLRDIRNEVLRRHEFERESIRTQGCRGNNFHSTPEDKKFNKDAINFLAKQNLWVYASCYRKFGRQSYDTQGYIHILEIDGAYCTFDFISDIQRDKIKDMEKLTLPSRDIVILYPLTVYENSDMLSLLEDN